MPDQCALFSFLFWAAVVLILAGNALGMLAWRHRRPEHSKWLLLKNQLYLFRSSSFQDPPPTARYWAIGALVLGAASLIGAAAIVLPHIARGASGFCGSVF